VLSLLATNGSFSQTTTDTKTKTGGEIAELLTKLKNSQEGPERVDILLKLCKAYRGSDPGKALDYAKQGLALSKKINYHEGISDSFHQLGVYHFFQGNYSNALEYYSKSLNIREELRKKGSGRKDAFLKSRLKQRRKEKKKLKCQKLKVRPRIPYSQFFWFWFFHYILLFFVYVQGDSIRQEEMGVA
jgi:tetratricopeptide (TPR) repeat protein